jgi:hypothetical protein
MRVRSILAAVAMIAGTVVSTAAPVGAAVVMCDGLEATHVGTTGDDLIVGTPGDDVIAALRGNDRVFAGAGDDVVCLGPGNDFARGQQGIDILLGGAGRDVMFGNAGGDILFGGDGPDVLWGGVGPDDLWAGPGNDIINAGHGNDFAVGGTGNDKLNGSTGADEMFGGQGADVMTGGKGFDDLAGQGGSDLITGGPGQDLIEGGPGSDRCRIDMFDFFFSCERGNVFGGSGPLVNGAGSVSVELTPEFVLPSPDGPSYVLHIDALPLAGQEMTVSVFGANQEPIFEGTGRDRLFSNVLIFSNTEPATVQISGAEFWQAAFLKTTTLFTDLVGLGDAGSQVFGIAPSVNGRAQFVLIDVENTSAENSIFQIATIGPQGVLLELNETLLPCEVVQFTGAISAAAQYVAVLTGAVNWQFDLPNR